MLTWKLNIFVDAIKALMQQENKTGEEIINRYTKLTKEEKVEILKMINTQ